MTGTRLHVLGLAAALLSAFSCGGDSGEASVLLIVATATDAPRPEQIQIDVYKDDNAVPESVVRVVPEGVDARLGDIVVYPSPGVAMLRFAVFGKRAGAVVSSALEDVGVVRGKQIFVEALLRPGVPDVDGGLLPADAGSDGGADAISDGHADEVSPGAGDAGVDAMPVKKMTGEVCEQGNECASGACVDNVCCNKACDGRCNSCKAAGQPVGQCTPVADGTKCGEPMCSANGKNITQHMCMAGGCQSQQRNCATRTCDAASLTCN